MPGLSRAGGALKEFPRSEKEDGALRRRMRASPKNGDSFFSPPAPLPLRALGPVSSRCHRRGPPYATAQALLASPPQAAAGEDVRCGCTRPASGQEAKPGEENHRQATRDVLCVMRDSRRAHGSPHADTVT
uniref:Uncharacterized protein n=1 Tax=Rousettus aegyptiacus TaxID=9407 RepID=A0A7J8F0K7_ROUAE|nr:hypothetical protein HJG63_012427 [Rousettus aegyptiacus]